MILPPPFVPRESILTGVGASPGVAIGPVCLAVRNRLFVPRYHLRREELVAEELARYEEAQKTMARDLKLAKTSLPAELSSQSGIFEAHLMLLEDPILTQSILYNIRELRKNAEWAVMEAVRRVSDLMGQVEDLYIRSRLNDVEMVAQGLIAALLDENAHDVGDCPQGSIVLARNLTPAEMLQLGRAGVAGLATEQGSRTSHMAIIAQALGLPAVVGARGLSAWTGENRLVIIDGDTGHLIIDPDQDALNFYRTRRDLEQAFTAEIVRSSHLPALTLDDHQVEILGNLELMEELPAIISCGGEGIGLYRTEIMFLAQNHPPSEEELFETYKRVVESAAPRPVTIRTLDVGYDKTWPSESRFREDRSQTLGLRGIRYSFKNIDFFLVQLRAILRASAFGHLKIMLPMVSQLEEIREGRRLLEAAGRELKSRGQAYDEAVPLGLMIEVPAAVIMAPELAREADFFSIGTNDLIQYTLAVDRSAPEVAELYQPLNPAILRMIRTTLQAGAEAGIPVSVCGDMAANPLSAAALVGLGARILSMPSAAIPKIKRLVRMSSFHELEQAALQALTCGNSQTTADLILELLEPRMPELFLPGHDPAGWRPDLSG